MNQRTPSKILFFVFLVFIFASCATKKSLTTKPTNKKTETVKTKTQTTTTPVNSRSVTEPKTEPTSTSVAKTTTAKTKASATKKTPVPPVSLKKKFESSYPTAKEIVWTRKTSTTKTELEHQLEYKVYFLLDSNRNTLTYSNEENLIETRIQILPEQLPPNIHAAIKSNYPTGKIVYAASLKNSMKEGAYIANIILPQESKEIELILMEDGSFVE